MPSSGARAGTIPSRTSRGAGSGRITLAKLTCGHLAPPVPAYRPAGGGHAKFWCDDCGTYRRRA